MFFHSSNLRKSSFCPLLSPIPKLKFISPFQMWLMSLHCKTCTFSISFEDVINNKLTTYAFSRFSWNSSPTLFFSYISLFVLVSPLRGPGSKTKFGLYQSPTCHGVITFYRLAKSSFMTKMWHVKVRGYYSVPYKI